MEPNANDTNTKLNTHGTNTNKMHDILERRWITAAGMDAMVWLLKKGYRVGYVKIDPQHPVCGHHLLDPIFDGIDVHGGITFSNMLTGDFTGWYVGFDCALATDEIRSPSKLVADFAGDTVPGGHWWTLDEVASECEHLAKQLRIMQTDNGGPPK